jgi:hypothetical protein
MSRSGQGARRLHGSGMTGGYLGSLCIWVPGTMIVITVHRTTVHSFLFVLFLISTNMWIISTRPSSDSGRLKERLAAVRTALRAVT